MTVTPTATADHSTLVTDWSEEASVSRECLSVDTGGGRGTGLKSSTQHHSTGQMSAPAAAAAVRGQQPAAVYVDRRLHQLRAANNDNRDAMHRFKYPYTCLLMSAHF